MQCPLHELARNDIELKLSRSIGLYHLDPYDLLWNEDDDNIPNYRETIRRELVKFIRATGRFQPSPRAPQNPLLHHIVKVNLSKFTNEEMNTKEKK